MPSELLANVLGCEYMFEQYATDPSYRRKLRIFALLALSEDIPTARACSGTWPLSLS
jgi:hypothetical protein